MRSRTSRWARLLALATVGLGLVAAPLAASAAPAERVEICHYDADLAVYKLIKVAQISVNDHLRNHPDGYPGGTVPGQPRGYTFSPSCAIVPPAVINFDDVDASQAEIPLGGSYQGFSWTAGFIYGLKTPGSDQYGYTSANGSPNIGFIGYPGQNPALTLERGGAPDVSFVSVFVTNPTGSGTDPDGPITVTIQAFDDGAPAGQAQVVLADGASQTVTLPFDSVDTLKMSAGGKYFGIDDLTYFVSPN